jgi:signal transduction histidine kinase/ActR/RegA family two-component response regulator
MPTEQDPILFYSSNHQCKSQVKALLADSEYQVMSGHNLKDLPEIKALSYFHLILFCPSENLEEELQYLQEVKRYYPAFHLPVILLDPAHLILEDYDLEGLGIQDYRTNLVSAKALKFSIARQLKRRANFFYQEEQLKKLDKENKAKNVLLEEVSLKAQESERLKTAFLNNISHELRTPMNGILGFLEFLEDPHLEGEIKEQFIKNIRVSSERLLNTLQDLIEISEIEAGDLKVKFQSVNLQQLGDYIYKLYLPRAEAKGLKLSLKSSLKDDEMMLWSDPSKLKGVFFHLLNNAIKFTNQGSIEIEINKLGEEVQFSVRDTGIGMNATDIDNIYQHFVQIEEHLTRKYDGLGLGLSICNAYSRCLNGKLHIDSKLDEGTLVQLSVPYITGKTESPKMPREGRKDVHFSKVRILLVDDDPINLQLLQKFLKDSTDELYTKTAKNGVEAVEYFKQDSSFDLILMDLKMPLMNGFQATKIIRELNPEIPIIAQTAYAMHEDKERALNCGCTDYLSKPLNKSLFYQTLDRYLTKPTNA